MTNIIGNGRQAGMVDKSKGDILTSAIFRIAHENGDSALFSELAGINSEVEQVEYMEAGEKGPTFGRFIGKAKPPTITLKRAMSKGKDTLWVWEWHQQARWGFTTAYRTTTFELIGAGSEEPVLAYSLVNAWPSKVDIAGMKAGGTEVVLQTVTLMCDEILGA